MHSAGPKGPTDKRSAELIGGLYLVGARGKCCAVITERQLTIERFDGKGVRLDLAAIERMRHLKVPMLPSGTVMLGLVGVYLGITTFVAPMSWLAIGLGTSVMLANIVSRYAILAIETGSGDRHLVSGSEANLLKLCLMVDRVRHGSDIDEALLGLESLETELPTFPAIRDATGQLNPPSQAALPAVSETSLLSGPTIVPGIHVDLGPKGKAEMKSFDWPPSEVFGHQEPASKPMPEPAPAQASKQNAYERAWGGREAPSWYKEKEVEVSTGNRMDSAFSDAAEGLDMFAPGGLFDAGTSTEAPSIEEFGLFSSEVQFDEPEFTQRVPSSSQMIKRAHEEFGSPSEPFSKQLLPPPTEEAVREECRAGIVKRAKARQELRVQQLRGADRQPANLEDYPALNRLASTMTSSKISGVKSESRPFSTGLLGRLLRPRGSINRAGNIVKVPDDEITTKRFQTSQHMRLRSDQDHQAEVGSRIRTMRRAMDSSTARDKLDSIVSKLSSGEEDSPRLLEAPEDSLRFSQLRPTSSEEDPHPLPGLRRLG